MDKHEYNFDRLTVPKPDPVTEPDPHDKRWIGLMLLFTALIAGLVLTHTQRMPDRLPAETWPEAGPSAVFGVSQCPEPERCPIPKPVDNRFLSRFVGALDEQADSPREIRDVLHRCYIESRFTPDSVSDTGDYGICQINAGANPDVDVDRLLTDPVYAAGECLRVYRVMFDRCGADWQCCYRYGVKGCKGRVMAAGGGE